VTAAGSVPFDPLALEIAGKILVEASAGTGKTHSITTLFVRLVLEQGLAPGEILVVTFTEAATAELRSRIRGRLTDAHAALERARSGRPAGDEVLGRLLERNPDKQATFRERLERARATLDEAAISTIHGFCHRVLHDHALGTRTRFDAELVADLEEIEQDVLHDFFRRHFARGESGFARDLREHKIGPEALRRIADMAFNHSGARLIPEPGVLSESASRAVVAFEHAYVDFARKELRERKEARAVLGFDDLLTRVREALAGPDGEALGRALSARFRVALIDEFQDTDSTQSAIFNDIFVRNGRPLLLIGDPKQAIYGFRGADVWSYLALTRDARHQTLGTSYRSDPGLLAGVNQLFSGRDPFLVPDIQYREVLPRPGAENVFHAAEASGSASIELVLLTPEEGAQGPATKGPASRAATRVVAAEVRRLLDGGGTIAGKAVTEEDIAVITRTNLQCFDVQEALRQKGIHAVVIGDKDVLSSDEAEDLTLVLPAVLDPTSRSAVRRALSSILFGESADGILALDSDPLAAEAWAERFQRWHALWVERGTMRMIRAVFDDSGVPARLLTRPGGERRLTNYLHLAELLHRAAAAEHLGPAAVLAWLLEQRREGTPAPEHAEIRLESDARAVRVLTAHKAKGLEFGVVFCPFLWDGRGEKDSGPPKLFHDGDHAVVDLNVEKKVRKENITRVQWEAHAEERRVVYVALTRAKHRLTMIWLHGHSMGWSAASTLFHPPAALSPADMPKQTYLKDSAARISEDLERMAERSGGAIALRRVPWAHDAPPLHHDAPAAAAPRARRVEQRVLPSARTESFSALTKRERPRPDDAEEGRDHDAATVIAVDETSASASVNLPSADAPPADAPLGVHVASASASPSPSDRIALDGFPRGRRAGDFFHSILEVIDFTTADSEELIDTTNEKFEQFGFARGEPLERRDEFIALAIRALRHTLDTPLDAGSGLSLSAIPKERRLSELEFRVPVASSPPGLELTPKRLAAAFRAHPSPALPASYADRVERLAFPALSGFLKGYIDLVFVHDERFYVVDYKTNHLGDVIGDYDTARMTAEMAESHYFLQYHLYTLAVERLFRRFHPGYSYDRNFGGVYYLFMKGMRPGAPGGVFFEKPPLARLDALSRALGGER